MKSKFKSEKNKKQNNIKQCIKENKKKDIKIDMMTVTLTFKYLFTYFNHMYLYVLVNIIQKLYNKIHPNNILFLTLFLRWIHYLVLCCYFFTSVIVIFKHMTRYFNFEPSFKLWWCRVQDLFGSQIPMSTGRFELQISCIRSSYLTQ